ncbi:MAG: SurA N-terminal domain-containing protein [Bacteroidia bacterium]|nr:SurA N-terminal domain-containing protein [Bacteroidia bacterium]NNJ55329.1 hypothetical protein [Bacteroidia bacterium]
MSDKYNKEEPSVLQKIQNQTGCLLLVIGVAMLAFVLTDLFSSGGSLFSSNRNSVGSIAGEHVSYDEFNNQYESLKAAVLQNNPGIQMNEMMVEQYRQQAWDMLVESKVQEQEYAKLGLTISPAELEDLTIGEHTHPQIQQSFRDPETNEFNKSRLIRFLKEDVYANPEAKESWAQFQKQFEKGLITEKYGKLIQSSFYTTDLEARNNAKESNLTYNASLVAVSYESVADSTVTVTDSDLSSYLKEHAAEYEQEESRDIEFISLKVIPSKEDSAGMLNWAKESMERFSTTKMDDSTFVSLSNSETPYNPTYMVRGSFPPEVENDIFNAEVGSILGPYETGGVYSVYKISDVGIDTARSVKGSHIVFRINGASAQDTLTAMSDARELLSKIRSGQTTFEEEAKQRNFDATRSTGGDMGWIREGNYTYPKELVDKLMTAGKGNYVVVKSDRGVHLAKATSNVSRKTVKAAALSQTLYASTATDGSYYRQAGDFLTKLNGDKSFEEVAESMGLSKRVASKINENERRVAGISNGNIVARWLFADDTDEGDISSILDIDDTYIVARVSKVREAGMPKVDDIRDEIETKVKNEIKAKQIIPKFEAAVAKSSDAETLAKELGTIVSVVPAASLQSGNIPYVGQDYILMGTIFGTPPGKRSEIVQGTSGVGVVYVNSENQYDIPDLQSKKIEMNSNNQQRYAGKVNQALMKKAEVKDTRYKFYD